ncbi:DNA polymerase III subunit beta [Sulfidibacter corallicola]|uniref:Beta sliding clamp n=1 Tax=Sulfidibacter corallicola TaxID=2818388 RepID=A0A8A4TX58_SULCO|nr:DNA polymerase III subunit beta [Sulfidibacter corallicola]QTD53704.1 DNA polymerase III subunit beta [Sulfidibacter corallicola]
MEFHIVRNDLLSELQLMMGVIEKKNTMPILANIFIRAENNHLILQATDLEVGIISQCPAQVIEPGEITVHAKNLQDMLNTFSDSQVSFSMNEGTMLNLDCGAAQFSIETMSTQDFPSIPECEFATPIKFRVGFFTDCINKVLFSVSTDPHKYALNGSLLRVAAGDLALVSTDGHRMSVVNKGLGPDFNDMDIIIPRKTLVELLKSLKATSSDEEFEIDFVENRIFFKIGPRVLFSRLIDGKFPDYNKAIPLNNDKSFVLERSKLLEIVRRKSVLSSDKSKLVRLSFGPGEMVVVLKNAERGESIDKLSVDYDGEMVDVGFNVDYLLEFLKNMNVEKIEINIRDNASQGLFKLVDEGEELDYKHIIMPMRLTG